MQMESRLGGSNFKRKQLAIMLFSFSVSKNDSQNSQNKEDQVQDKAKKRKQNTEESRGFLQSW